MQRLPAAPAGGDGGTVRRARPRVSVIIPAYGGEALLARCLGSLGRLGGDGGFETVVVLNGGHIAWGPEHAGAAPEATVVRSEVNLGFGGGCNLGAAAAHGELLVLLNDDAVVRDGWLAWLVRAADAHPEAGAVGGRIVSGDGRLLEAASVVFANGYTLPVGSGLEEDSLEWDFVREVDYCSGASLLVRRSAWEQCGGFDEDYHPAYCEDTDLCFRLRQLGWTVLFEPRSCIEHDGGGSTDAGFREYVWRRNHHRFVERWSERLDLQVRPPAGTSRFRAAVERASDRARGWPRHALVVGGGAQAPPLDETAAAARWLGRRGYAVCYAPGRGPAATSDALRDLGVRVVDDLAESLARPETLVDEAYVLGDGDGEAVALLRRHQPHARVLAISGAARPWSRSGAAAASIPWLPMSASSMEPQAGGGTGAAAEPGTDAAAQARERHHLLLDLAVKDGYIVELRSALQDAEEGARAAAGAREAEVARLALEVARLDTAVTGLEAAVAERDARISAMEALLHGRAHRAAEAVRRGVRRILLG